MSIDQKVIEELSSPISKWQNENDKGPKDGTYLNGFIGAMVNVALAKVRETNLSWTNSTCKVDYEGSSGGISLEKASYFMGIVSLAWLAKLVQGKISIGHCWVHKEPCDLGKEFHKKIGKDIAKSLRELADILDSENVQS